MIYQLRRLLETLRMALWAKVQTIVWKTQGSRDQLDQIIWRLEMNESRCPPDTRAALNLARMLRRKVYG